MPKAKTIQQRVIQVARYLKDLYSLDRLWRVEFVDCRDEDDWSNPDDDQYGWVAEQSKGLIIKLCVRCCRTRAIAVETTIHEFTHALLWDEGLGYYHGPTYWLQYGEIIDAFDAHGWSDSKTYPFD